ncbi:MAG: HDOD domain-containing protein [Bryobacterales bacterium]|nr:HDOD domain-containing protein [Bryobacterales bacterium]
MTPPSVSGAIAEDRVLAALDRLPPFSPVLNKVLASLSDEDVSFSELASTIETDTVLAGTLLRIVNSPLYGRRATINSVRHAVAIIGIVKIRNLVLGLTVSRRWTAAQIPKRWSMRHFNIHSLGVALLTDTLALSMPVPYPEGGFVAGLLHDIGKLLAATAAPEEFTLAMTRCEVNGMPFTEYEADQLGVRHAELSRLVLERWNLPVPIRDAVAYHHDPALADGGSLNLAHLVEAADAFVTGLGFPAIQNIPARPPSDAHAVGERIEAIRGAFEAEFESLRGFL